jgi:hypothetical protein
LLDLLLQRVGNFGFEVNLGSILGWIYQSLTRYLILIDVKPILEQVVCQPLHLMGFGTEVGKIMTVPRMGCPGS